MDMDLDIDAGTGTDTDSDTDRAMDMSTRSIAVSITQYCWPISDEIESMESDYLPSRLYISAMKRHDHFYMSVWKQSSDKSASNIQKVASADTVGES